MDGPAFGATGSEAERGGLGRAGCTRRHHAQPAAAGYMPEGLLLLHPRRAPAGQRFSCPLCGPLPVTVCVRRTGRYPVLRRSHEMQRRPPERYHRGQPPERDGRKPLLPLRHSGMEAAESAHRGQRNGLCKGFYQPVPAGAQCPDAGALAPHGRRIPPLFGPEAGCLGRHHQRTGQQPCI